MLPPSGLGLWIPIVWKECFKPVVMGKTESVSGYFPHVLLLWYDRDKQLAVTVFLSPVSVCCDRDALPLSLWNLAFSATHPEVTACWRDVQKLSALAFSVCSLMALESRWRNVRTDTYPAHPHNAVTTVLHPPCGPLGALRDSFFFFFLSFESVWRSNWILGIADRGKPVDGPPREPGRIGWCLFTLEL